MAGKVESRNVNLLGPNELVSKAHRYKFLGPKNILASNISERPVLQC